MNITMIGSGYVGLVSGSCLADFGHSVTCVDTDEQKIKKLKGGLVPIFEPGLDALIKQNLAAGRLRFTSNLSRAVSWADVIFVAVGTPSRRGDGYADLSYVYSAVSALAKAIVGIKVIVIKSTVPVGTGDEVERIIRETNPAADAVVVSNPEFLREGAAIEDFKRPDRIVVGLEDERAREVMSAIYRPLCLNQAPILFTGRRDAELIKYAGNAFLAMKITFINEIADLCERAGANVQEVARGIGLDNRIGSKFLNAGPGYGGSCFPKDTLSLVRTGQDYDCPLRLVETTVAVNSQRKRAMARKVIEACDGTVRNKIIGVLGLTFKPNTDDMRDAPSVAIIQSLKDVGAVIRAYDPAGMEMAKKVIHDIEYASNPYDVARNANCLVLITEWDAFRSLDMERLRRVMAEPRLVDLRNVYRRRDVEAAGFSYSSVGRPTRTASAMALSEAAE